MNKLTHDKLSSIRLQAQRRLDLREMSCKQVSQDCSGLNRGAEHLQILCCGGTGCHASDSRKIVENLRQSIAAHRIENQVDVVATGCFGFCEKGPIVKMIPDNTFYVQVKPEDAEELVTEHIIGGRRVNRLLYVDPKTSHEVSDSKHMDFYRKQMRIALRNCGMINPEDIFEYIARDGYRALQQVLRDQDPEKVIEEIKRSGLRGRGWLSDRKEMGVITLLSR